MWHSSRVFKSFFSLLIILAVSTLALADTIRLKDGSTIKGKIVGFSNGKFIVAMGDGTRKREMSFAADEVESVKFDDAGTVTNRTASYETPTTKNDPKSTSKVVVDNPPQKNSSERMKPITWNIKVTADSTANGWTNTGWVVKKGQRIRITGDGKVSLGKGSSSGPGGIASFEDSQKLLKNVATGALIAVIGDDNNDFIYVGSSREITATRDGALFLGINEGNLDDNTGSFNVKIEILPDEGS
ncbi:MAG: LecA/PA-IL family lectin [Pyrinomonadaceae bacterium]